MMSREEEAGQLLRWVSFQKTKGTVPMLKQNIESSRLEQRQIRVWREGPGFTV